MRIEATSNSSLESPKPPDSRRRRLAQRFTTAVVVFLCAVLVATALPLASAAAQEDAPPEFVGVFDDDFNVTSDRFTVRQRVSIQDPGTASGSMRKITLWMRNLADACQNGLVVRVTDPQGESTTQRPFRGCTQPRKLHTTTIELPAAGAGTWTVAYRGTDDQTYRVPAVRIDAFGPPLEPVTRVAPVNPFEGSAPSVGITLLGGDGPKTKTPLNPLSPGDLTNPGGPEDPPLDVDTCPSGDVVDAVLALTAIMTGPYDPESRLMRDDLRAFGAIPTIDPYFGRAVVDEVIFDITGPDAIVDWVVVELRHNSPANQPQDMDPAAYVPSSWAVQVPALIQRDGDIVDVDGVSPVRVPANLLGRYRPVVWHRSHAPTAFPTFTHVPSQIVQASPNYVRDQFAGLPGEGDDPEAELSDGSEPAESAPLPMTAGDANGDFDINGQDKAVWSAQNGSGIRILSDGSLAPGVYLNGDFNMDGSVDGSDKISWEATNGQFFFLPGGQECAPGTHDTGNPITYPEVTFRPDHVSSYGYSVTVDQLFVAPNLEGDVSTNNPADNEVERNRMDITADLDFTAFAIEGNSQWVRLDVTNAVMTPTSGRYEDSSFGQVDQTTPIAAADASPSEWSESDVWADTDTPTQTLSDQLSRPTYFRRDLDGAVLEIIHPIPASGIADNLNARNIKEGMINLLSMELAGATDEFSVLEQDRSGRRSVEYTATQSGGDTIINRSTPGGTAPADTEGLVAGSAAATITMNADGETSSIVSTEVIEIDEGADSDTVDASDPFAEVAPLKAKVWTQSTLTVSQVPAPLSNPTQAAAEALADREGNHLRTVLSDHAAQQLHDAAEIGNNTGLEAEVRSGLDALQDDLERWLESPTFALGDDAATLVRLFPSTAQPLAADAAAGSWSRAAQEIVVGTLGSVGNREAQLGLVDYASTVTDSSLRQMAIISMVLIEDPIDEVIDYLQTTVSAPEDDPFDALESQGGDVVVGNDVTNSAMLVLGSLGGRLDDPQKAEEIRAELEALQLASDSEVQRVASDSLENFAANRPGSESPLQAFAPGVNRGADSDGGASEFALRSATADATSQPAATAKVLIDDWAYPIGGPFWGHCGWVDSANGGDGGWVAAGVSQGPMVSWDGGTGQVRMFGHPALGTTPPAPMGDMVDNGAFLVATAGSCYDFEGTGVEGHFYGHCVRLSVASESGPAGTWVDPGTEPGQPSFSQDVNDIWWYSGYPGSVWLRNSSSVDPWGNPPELLPYPLIAIRLPPGECRLLNAGEWPDGAGPSSGTSSTGEPDNEGFHWEKQFGPNFVHADLYASLDLPRSNDRGAVFRAEAGANVTVAGRTATVFRAKAESALDLVDETSANNLGANNEIGQIERDLTLQGWFFNNKVIDKEIGIPCGVGASGELFQIPALNLSFSKTIMVAGFIPVEFAGGLGASISSPWEWSADACDIVFGSDALVTLAGSVAVEGRAEAHLTAGINLIIIKGGGGVGGTLIGFGANAGASLQLFRPSTNRGPELCFSFGAQLIPPSISAYVWYKLLWKKKKTKDLFSWNPTFPSPVNIASSCPPVEAHRLEVQTGSHGGNDPGPTFSNPTWNGHRIAIPDDAAQGLMNDPGEGMQARMVTGGDSGTVFDTIAAFCASQGFGAPVVSATETSDSSPTAADVKYAYVDGAWGYEDAGLGFQQVDLITCANGDVAMSTAIVDPATGDLIPANSPSGAVVAVPPGVTDTQVQFTVSNVGDETIYQLGLDRGSLGVVPNCPSEIAAGATETCTMLVDTTNATGQVVTHEVQINASATAGGDVSNFGSFNWYTCLGCAPSGGTPGGTNPTGPDPDPVPVLGLDVTDVEIKAADVGWRQNATGAQVPHVEVPASVSVFITVENTHSEALTDLEFQGMGLNGSGNCGGSVVDPGDSITCKITFVPVNTGTNARTVKAFGVSADATSQPVYSNLENWSMFGEVLRLTVTDVTLNGADAMSGRPAITQSLPIAFTIQNPNGPGAVDLDSLQMTSAGLTNVSCPFRLDVNDPVDCTATVSFDPNVTETVEFDATFTAEGVVSDRSTETDVTWGWSAPPRPWEKNLEITDIQAISPDTGTVVTSNPANNPIDVRVTVQNNGTETVTDLTFDLIGSGHTCETTPVGAGASVDCVISEVAVEPGTTTTVVRVEGAAPSADYSSDPFSYTLTGEAPRIEITDITIGQVSALDPVVTPGTTPTFTNLGLEEGTHQVNISILNTGSASTPGAVTVNNLVVTAMGLDGIACPASIAPGTTAECQATLDVWPNDAAVSRSVQAEATYGGDQKVSDNRALSWSYRPKFSLEMRYTSELAPEPLALAPTALTLAPGDYRVGVMLTNSETAGTLDQLEFDLSSTGATPTMTCNPATVVPAGLAASQQLECEILVTVASDDQTVTVTAMVDGVTKEAEVELIADLATEVVDVGEPPAGLAPSNQWGTGTGGFVITPMAGEPMPTSIDFGGRVITGDELAAFSYPDDSQTQAMDWEIEIIPNRGQVDFADEEGTIALSYQTSDGPVDRTFHVVLADEFDELLNERFIDVTNYTLGYDKTEPTPGTEFSNTVVLANLLPEAPRVGSVLVHSGGGASAHPEAPNGFIQVVGEVMDLAIAGGSGPSGSYSTRTKNGDLLDSLRQKRTRNSTSGSIGNNSGSSGNASVDVSFDVNFESSFTPEFEIEIEWKRASWYSVFPSPVLEYLRVGAHASAGVSYNARATAVAEVGGTFPILAPTRLLAFPVGPVSVTVRVSAEGVWNVAAEGTLAAEGGISASVAAWAEYRNTGAAPTPSESSFNYGFVGDFTLCEALEGTELEDYPIGNTCFKPSYSGTFTAEAGLDIDIALLIADQAGPKVTIGPRLSMAAGFTQNGVAYDLDFAPGIELDLSDDTEGLVDGLENARVVTGGDERDPKAGTADGVKKKSRSSAIAGFGVKFRGIAKRVFPEDFDFELGRFFGRWLEDYTAVFGKIVNTCAYARLAIPGANSTMRDWWNAFPGGSTTPWNDVTKTQMWGWRPPYNGNPIPWHGHHIVPKNPTRNNSPVYALLELHEILEDAEIRVLTSCRNLVWAPNNSGDYTTPGHFASGLNGWDQLWDDMGTSPSQSHVKDVLKAWSEKACESYADFPNNPLNGSEAETFNNIVCDL